MPEATQPQSKEPASTRGPLHGEVCAHSLILSNMTTVTGLTAAASASQALPPGQGNLARSSRKSWEVTLLLSPCMDNKTGAGRTQDAHRPRALTWPLLQMSTFHSCTFIHCCSIIF